jgi:hypothetical protein
VEDLRQEMEEWQQSLESNGMEHLPKYEEVEEAVTLLEQAVGELEELNELVGDLSDEIKNKPIYYTYDTRRKAGARWGRLSNGQVMARTALRSLAHSLAQAQEAEARDRLRPGDQDEVVEAGETPDWIMNLESALYQWEEGITTTEEVCFPGMY